MLLRCICRDAALCVVSEVHRLRNSYRSRCLFLKWMLCRSLSIRSPCRWPHMRLNNQGLSAAMWKVKTTKRPQVLFRLGTHKRKCQQNARETRHGIATAAQTSLPSHQTRVAPKTSGISHLWLLNLWFCGTFLHQGCTCGQSSFF